VEESHCKTLLTDKLQLSPLEVNVTVEESVEQTNKMSDSKLVRVDNINSAKKTRGQNLKIESSREPGKHRRVSWTSVLCSLVGTEVKDIPVPGEYDLVAKNQWNFHREKFCLTLHGF